MGRRSAEIDKKQFEGLCAIQCTRDEICTWFGVSPKTLYAWCKREYKSDFSTVFAQKREGGKISLRRKQWQLAEKSPAMAIFLGKNYLGQSDKVETEATVNVTPAPEVRIYLPDNGRDGKGDA